MSYFYHILPNGTGHRWPVGSAPANVDGHLIPFTETPKPSDETDVIYVEDVPEIILSDGLPIEARQLWVPRPKTADEKRVVWTSLELKRRFTNQEWAQLRALAKTNDIVANLLDELLLATTVVSDDQATLVAITVVTEIFGSARAREIFSA